ncbi:class I adenylate-forming enzyme family protein [Hwanghaeella grinnelliae]|uniref:class I adenylate-forming enzyme family protein n=1 Tax=Hwanghaeella grinnelliae TaxID=2500179 RepID=UPI00138682F0|nr:class I adenylate-forming enzyme family protein [Hwanghaeella grinnelliae]
MTDYPSTVSYIGYHAATAPGHPAIIEGGRGVSYRDFYRDIGKMAGALADFGIGPGDMVAIEITGFYRHWVMLLACEVLGAGTLSFNQSEVDALGRHFRLMDRVICSSALNSEAFEAANEPGYTEQAPKVHVTDQEWLSAVAQRAVVDISPSVRLGADAPARIVKSYGTMGMLQLMVHTGRVHDFWLRQFRFRTTMDRNARYLLTAGFGIQAFHVHATSCIRMGGTCVCGNPNELAQDIGRYGITHATFMPNQLEQLLAAQGEEHLKPRLRQVFTIGAPAAKQVRARARQILVDEISESYGTNEAGGICSMDDDGVGAAFPGVEVEAVGADGNACFGSQGQIRVKSAGVVDGYLGDPETTARMFRDGWFYPGDIGVLYDRHRLTLAGRIEDFLEIDGTKYSLNVLEKALIDALPAKDICLLAGGGPDVALTLLVLTESPEDTARIRQEAQSLLPPGVDRITVIEARKIPRGTDGTVQRAKLGWQLQQALTGNASD